MHCLQLSMKVRRFQGPWWLNKFQTPVITQKTTEKRTKNEDALGSIISESKGILSERCFFSRKTMENIQSIEPTKKLSRIGIFWTTFCKVRVNMTLPMAWVWCLKKPPPTPPRSFETRRRAKEKGKRSDEPWRKRIAGCGWRTTTASMVAVERSLYVWNNREISEKDNWL